MRHEGPLPASYAIFLTHHDGTAHRCHFASGRHDKSAPAAPSRSAGPVLLQFPHERIVARASTGTSTSVSSSVATASWSCVLSAGTVSGRYPRRPKLSASAFEVRIVDMRAHRAAAREVLLPTDQAVIVVVEDEAGEAGAEALGRLQLLHVHHEPAVAHGGHHLPIRVGERRSNAAGQRNPHAGESVRGDAAARATRREVAGNPPRCSPRPRAVRCARHRAFPARPP